MNSISGPVWPFVFQGSMTRLTLRQTFAVTEAKQEAPRSAKT